MEWNPIVEKVTPYLLRIETPRGHGTGFFCFHSDAKEFSVIATALHVIEHADTWQEPIRIYNQASKTSTLLRNSDRVIYTDWDRDSAVILLSFGKLKLPEEVIPLRPTENRLSVAAEVGWLGYPAPASYTLCFFSGNVSAWQEFRHAYLIDGVAINGVSGGPVIYSTAADGVQIVGTISAYMANRATGESLPGLSVAQDVSSLHDHVRKIKTLDEAYRKREQEKKETPPESTTPTGRST